VTGSLAGLLVLALIAIPLVDDDESTTETAGDVSTARSGPTTTRHTPTTHRTTTTVERTTTTTQPDEPQTLPIGQTLDMVVTDFEGGETFVNVTVANPATFTEEPVDYGSTPQNGLYLVVDVTVAVTAGSEGTYPVSETDFKFVAADGSVAETTFAMGFDPMLQYTELAAGQRASGTIVFDINPAQQAGAKIQITDMGDDYGEPFAYWAL
jgi:hypothetical protein